MCDLDAIRADILDTKSSVTAPVEGAGAIVAQLAQQPKTAERLNEEEYPDMLPHGFPEKNNLFNLHEVTALS